MTSKSKLSGLGTALITPFTTDDRIDFAALEQLVERQITAGTNYLVVLGTTGEAVTLTQDEKEQVIDCIVSRVAGRLPLVLGLGGNCTAAVVEQLRRMDDTLRHFAAILSVCPYYNKPSQEGLYAHFCAIAEVSPVPVILYNVPGRTGVNMLPETVMRIYHAHPDKIIGVKEASGNMEQIGHLIDLARQGEIAGHRLLVISGDDGLAADVMQRGGDGLISVAANAYPVLYEQMIKTADTSLQTKMSAMVKLLFQEGNPSGIKALLASQGLIQNRLRLPLVSCSASLTAAIGKANDLLGNA